MPPRPAPASVHWLWPLLLLLGSVTVTVAWVLVALNTRGMAAPMALAAGLETAWMLRLGTLRGGPLRITLAITATLLVTLASYWVIVAAHMGGMMGLDPLQSSLRMGPRLAWTMVSLASSPFDLLWLLGGLLLAWRLAR